ncbi:uncharacterized protein LOC130979611 [Arachis stenosperma]|uniref:uncharacterized protein LOC130979611 n=1 Tax=Arachis stenosperma TaxID=217475 RepID=UPI0025AC2AA5|nr:uncharacterized protein LOC130979611 [Arachis stenosperma]
MTIISSSSSFSPNLFLHLNHHSAPTVIGLGLSLRRRPITKPNIKLRRRHLQRCRAVFADDAPFAAAIGACMLTSLVLPVAGSHEDDEEGESAMNTSDTRFAVMGIMSFIPYFNWLSWIFALLDTGNRRYAVYAIVYLAPYLRSNLSISPEDSWLPIASILFCIVHIQLEASIRNGDIQGFQLFRNVTDQLSSKKGHLNHHQEISKQGMAKDNKNLPSAQDHLRDIGDWEDTQRPLQSHQPLSEDLNDDEEEERSKH